MESEHPELEGTHEVHRVQLLYACLFLSLCRYYESIRYGRSLNQNIFDHLTECINHHMEQHVQGGEQAVEGRS